MNPLKYALLLLLIISPGCSKGPTPVAQATEDKILLMGNSGDPQSLDPHITAGYPEKKIHSGLFEGLVLMHPEDLSPIPGVAESWDVSEDGKTYTFHLRKEARWSNGAPLTAQDFFVFP